jgi:hypothetical protein
VRKRRFLGQLRTSPNSDEDDSILCAEIAASRALIGELDSHSTRVGLVVFAGDSDAQTPDAYTEVPLTSDFGEVGRGLDRIHRHGAHGGRNMVTGVNLAVIELLGTPSAKSEKRDDAKQVILFFVGGQPTLPLEASFLANAKLTVKQAIRARFFGIRIDTFAIGEDVLSEPVVPREIARVSAGVFTPIRGTSDVPAAIGAAYLSGVEDVVIRNETTGQKTTQILRRPYGSFAALVPAAEGENRIEVHALLREGWPEAAQTLTVRFDPNAEESLSPRSGIASRLTSREAVTQASRYRISSTPTSVNAVGQIQDARRAASVPGSRTSSQRDQPAATPRSARGACVYSMRSSSFTLPSACE